MHAYVYTYKTHKYIHICIHAHMYHSLFLSLCFWGSSVKRGFEKLRNISCQRGKMRLQIICWSISALEELALLVP